MLLRIILTDTEQCRTREEICTQERHLGERDIFPGYNTEWAGYIIDDDTMRLSGQWLLETDDLVGLIKFLKRPIPVLNHTVTLYAIDDEEEQETKVLEIAV